MLYLSVICVNAILALILLLCNHWIKQEIISYENRQDTF